MDQKHDLGRLLWFIVIGALLTFGALVAAYKLLF